MPNMIFKLSDNAKAEAIWNLLNPDFGCKKKEDYVLIDVFEKYALCYSLEEGCYYQIDYAKSDEIDEVSLGAKRKCFIEDITENEKAALDALRVLNGGSFESINDNFVQIESVNAEKEENEQKFEELNASISTLTTEKESLEAQFTEASETIASLQEELDSLKEFKVNIETQEKKSVIDKYAEMLDNEVITSYTEKIAEYTVDALEKDLAFELVKANPSVFSHEPQQPIFLKDDDQQSDGLSEILSHYKK